MPPVGPAFNATLSGPKTDGARATRGRHNPDCVRSVSLVPQVHVCILPTLAPLLGSGVQTDEIRSTTFRFALVEFLGGGKGATHNFCDSKHEQTIAACCSIGHLMLPCMWRG